MVLLSLSLSLSASLDCFLVEMKVQPKPFRLCRFFKEKKRHQKTERGGGSHQTDRRAGQERHVTQLQQHQGQRHSKRRDDGNLLPLVFDDATRIGSQSGGPGTPRGPPGGGSSRGSPPAK